MRVVPVPCLSDNYAYLVVCEVTGQAAVVDPGQAAPVHAAVAAAGARLVAVWATHHHPDHVGGVPDLVAAWPGLEVVAHRSDRARVPGCTRAVDDGDVVTVGTTSARILHNPGHTTGAISYVITGAAGAAGAAGAVFTGDTLFAAGCGRLFEGSAADMWGSLSRLAALPADTAVYFGHEYTASNLRFAAAVEPDSAAVQDRVRVVTAARAAGQATTPSTIALELATNPFVRADQPAVIAAARGRGARADDPSAVLAAIRAWKDSFR
ncbi:MAG: hydroxyacylglutathione hydrolase [Kofleriaceae bacterium]|nr:hydroxyacylglutathione hydrolase [Kofleriaceae bacterium]